MRDMPISLSELRDMLETIRPIEPLETQGDAIFTGLVSHTCTPIPVVLLSNDFIPGSMHMLSEQDPNRARVAAELFAMSPQLVEALLDRLAEAARLVGNLGLTGDEDELWTVLKNFS